MVLAFGLDSAAPVAAAEPGGQLANDYVFAAEEPPRAQGCLSKGATLRRCMVDNQMVSRLIRRIKPPLMQARQAKAKGGAEAIGAGYTARLVESQFIQDVADAFPKAFDDTPDVPDRLVDLVNAVALEVMDLTGGEPNTSLAALFHGVTRQRVDAIRAQPAPAFPVRAAATRPPPPPSADARTVIGKQTAKLIGDSLTGAPLQRAAPSPDQYVEVARLESAAAKGLMRRDFGGLQSIHEASEALTLRLEDRRESVSPELLGLQHFLMEAMLSLDDELQARTKAQPLPKPN